MTCPCGLTRLEFKLSDSRALFQGSRWNIEIAGFCSLPGSLRHSLTRTLVCQSKWWTANTGRTKTRSAELVCFRVFVKKAEWHLGIWRQTALLRWWGLFSGETKWWKHSHHWHSVYYGEFHFSDLYYYHMLVLFVFLIYWISAKLAEWRHSVSGLTRIYCT